MSSRSGSCDMALSSRSGSDFRHPELLRETWTAALFAPGIMFGSVPGHDLSLGCPLHAAELGDRGG